MIINIPLQVDEQKMEEVLKRDYEGKVLAEITKYVKQTLVNHSETYYGSADTKVIDGMRVLIESQIDKFLKDHSDEIIKNAGTALANKLARSKRGKELLEEVCNND